MSGLPQGIQISNLSGMQDAPKDMIEMIVNNRQWDPRILRPYRIEGYAGTYIDRPYQMVVNGKAETVYRPMLTTNATGVLTKDQWIELDQAIMPAFRTPLAFVADLRSSGLEKRIADGMATIALQHQTMSESGEASISMNPTVNGNADRVQYDLGSLPLPFIHGETEYNIRELATSARNGQGMDVSKVEHITTRIAETAERLALGVLPAFTHGGGTIYGLSNFPDRISYSMTLPTAPGWTPDVFVDEIIGMQQASRNAKAYGPWRLYLSPNWSPYLQGDYAKAYGGETLMTRVNKIEKLSGVKTLEFLTGWNAFLVTMNRSTIEEVVGMDPVPIQWQVGLDIKIKILTIQVPRIRSDFYGNCGIVHGVAS